ncbi:MAG: hypothetical protein MN733_01760, partial [Nitrososphaera sp.]|nr:hypothetical protein [Nitrososphaera sp.]
MNKLSKQDVFNIAYSHYANGGLPGYDLDTKECVYFADDGGHCAVGAVLAYLGYEREDLKLDYVDLSNKKVFSLIDYLPGFARRFRANVDTEFLHRLQRAHDTALGDIGCENV